MAQDFAKSFYNSVRWIKCRDSFMQSKHYLCERCGGLADICHHTTYLTPANIHDKNITLNWERLEALCQACHNEEHHGKYKRIIQDGLMFDENGNPKPIPPF